MIDRQDMERLLREARGRIFLRIIQPADGPAILQAALAGDLAADRLIGAVNNLVASIEEPIEKASVCACCRMKLLKHNYSVAVVRALGEFPKNFWTFPVCFTCATSNMEAHDKALKLLNKFWPRMRPVGGGGA